MVRPIVVSPLRAARPAGDSGLVTILILHHDGAGISFLLPEWGQKRCPVPFFPEGKRCGETGVALETGPETISPCFVSTPSGRQRRLRHPPEAGRRTSTLADRLDLYFQIEPAPGPIGSESRDSTLPRQRETGTISQRKPFRLRRRDQRRCHHRLLG